MDRAQRRVLAEAATAGPWEADGTRVGAPAPIARMILHAETMAADAAFIAANNPQQYLADCDEHDALVAEVERLKEHAKTRMWATVYERAAWQHDIGEHDASEFPYGFCPRCEMEHPLGRFRATLERAEAAEAAVERVRATEARAVVLLRSAHESVGCDCGVIIGAQCEIERFLSQPLDPS